MEKPLFDILKNISYKIISCSPIDTKTKTKEPLIKSLCLDSRVAKQGALFFALSGEHTDGTKYIIEAAKRGAVACVFSGDLPSCTLLDIKDINSDFVFVQVDNAQVSMAHISAAFFDFPAKKMFIVGVTGTQGKSSVVSFIWQLLRLSGKKAGFISTVEHSIGGGGLPNAVHQTTPQSCQTQEMLYQMQQAGCEFAVIEASSHGLSKKLNRLGYIDFDAGICTNVTLEHLEFHKTFLQYKSDKANLFRNIKAAPHTKTINNTQKTMQPFCIVNLDDPNAQYFIQQSKVAVYAVEQQNAPNNQNSQDEQDSTDESAKRKLQNTKNIKGIIDIKNTKSTTTRLDFDTQGYFSCHITSPTPGGFNAINLSMAILAVKFLTGGDIKDIAKNAQNLVAVKGRMTSLDVGQPFSVIVDYAHTPYSFQCIMPQIKANCKGKVFSVFGSGGERDTQKRPLQGQIAAKYCDIVILTDEDPRQEGSLPILQDIAVGAKKQGKVEGKDLFLIGDRKKAIKKAFCMAGSGDVVLLLGKSHENSIIYKDYVLDYDEIQTALDTLKSMGWQK